MAAQAVGPVDARFFRVRAAVQMHRESIARMYELDTEGWQQSEACPPALEALVADPAWSGPTLCDRPGASLQFGRTMANSPDLSGDVLQCIDSACDGSWAFGVSVLNGARANPGEPAIRCLRAHGSASLPLCQQRADIPLRVGAIVESAYAGAAYSVADIYVCGMGAPTAQHRSIEAAHFRQVPSGHPYGCHNFATPARFSDAAPVAGDRLASLFFGRVLVLLRPVAVPPVSVYLRVAPVAAPGSLGWGRYGFRCPEDSYRFEARVTAAPALAALVWSAEPQAAAEALVGSVLLCGSEAAAGLIVARSAVDEGSPAGLRLAEGDGDPSEKACVVVGPLLVHGGGKACVHLFCRLDGEGEAGAEGSAGSAPEAKRRRLLLPRP